MDEVKLQREIARLVQIELRRQLSHLLGDVMVIDRNVHINDGRTIQTGQTTGAIIGNDPLEKVGFHGVASAQAPKIADPTGGSVIDVEARTAINSLIDVSEGKGFSAS